MIHHHESRHALTTSGRARAIATAIAPRTVGATGNISTEDAGFLLSLIEELRPSRILEIGVASGTSTLMMLRLMEEVLPSAALDSVDLLAQYYPDPSKPVGYLVTEYYGRAPAAWRLVTGVGAASFASHEALVHEELARHYDFVFIDAHHGHPWPTLDALCLLPFVVPGCWIAFHDINLPLLGDWPVFGAVHVVRDWPLDVLIGDQPSIPNTGAIRLSDAGREDAVHLAEILARPWDNGIHPYHADKILRHLETFLEPATLDVVRRGFERNAELTGL